jgi:adenylate cyclase
LQEEARLSWAWRPELILRLSCTPLRDAQMHTIGVTLVFDDLTEQRRVEAEREWIRQTFGRVVAPRVRDRLLSDPSHLRVEGVRQPLTVLFADLSSFTPFSERTQPEKLLPVLNAYLSLAAQVVLEQEGTLDKFVGDAVMAFWNAPDEQPDHTLRAVRAALGIQRAAAAHRVRLSPEHHLHYKVSISCGDTMVGNVGSEGLFNYTAIGNTVNLAQRLESIAAPGQILISEAVYLVMQDRIVVRRLADTKVKGMEQPVAVYELLGMKPTE